MEELEKKWKGLRTTQIPIFISNVKYFKNVLDNKVNEPTPKFLDNGTLIHMYLLENDKFKNTYTYLDYTKPTGENQLNFCKYFAEQFKKDSKQNKKTLCIDSYKQSYKTEKKSDKKIEEEATNLYNQFESYIKFLTISDKEVISYSMWNYLREVKECINKHKLASNLVYEKEFGTEEHYNEQLVYWKFDKALIHNEPLIVKSTIDKLIIDHEKKVIKLVDLKTTNDMGEFDNRFEDHDNYKIQLACYWFAVETFFRNTFTDKNINEYSRETYLVAIQTQNPYKDYPVNCEVFTISDYSLNEGLNIIENVLPDIAWHFENDLWEHSRSYYEGNGCAKVL